MAGGYFKLPCVIGIFTLLTISDTLAANLQVKKLNDGLFVATQADQADLVEDLLRVGASANAQDESGVPILIYAVIHSGPPIINILLSRGATVGSQPSNLHPIVIAAALGRVDALKTLFTHAKPQLVNEALRVAAVRGDVYSIQVLLGNVSTDILSKTANILRSRFRVSINGDNPAADPRFSIYAIKACDEDKVAEDLCISNSRLTQLQNAFPVSTNTDSIRRPIENKKCLSYNGTKYCE